MGISLAEQIAALEEPTPVDFDPEATNQFESDTDERILPKDHYVDVGPSRMLDIALPDPQYAGVKVSRQQLEASGDETDQEELDEDSDVSQATKDSGPDDSSQEEEEGDESEVETPNDDVSPALTKSSPRSRVQTEQENDDLTTSLRKRREEDLRKGKSVAKQIAVWNKVMETRVHIQKISADASCLPQPHILSTLPKDPECQASLKRLLDETLRLSDDLFQIQENLMPETLTVPARKKRKVDLDLEECEAELHRHAELHSEFEQVYHPHLVQTLSKWSSKIQAVNPSALLPSTRNTFSQSTSDQQSLLQKSVVDQIESTLQYDYSKLLSRTRTRKTHNHNRIGSSSPHLINGHDNDNGDTVGGGDGTNNSLEDPELFDDTDFYQQLLRDVIDDNNGGDNDSWKVLQKQKKTKKKVDAKASKGRKIRYEVHEKLRNFMVPYQSHDSGWHEEQIDELFLSLLGKGVHDHHRREKEEDDVDVEMTTEAPMLQGFRVFG